MPEFPCVMNIPMMTLKEQHSMRDIFTENEHDGDDDV